VCMCAALHARGRLSLLAVQLEWRCCEPPLPHTNVPAACLSKLLSRAQQPPHSLELLLQLLAASRWLLVSVTQHLQVTRGVGHVTIVTHTSLDGPHRGPAGRLPMEAPSPRCELVQRHFGQIGCAEACNTPLLGMLSAQHLQYTQLPA
jgi:hypothetical protein